MGQQGPGVDSNLRGCEIRAKCARKKSTREEKPCTAGHTSGTDRSIGVPIISNRREKAGHQPKATSGQDEQRNREEGQLLVSRNPVKSIPSGGRPAARGIRKQQAAHEKLETKRWVSAPRKCKQEDQGNCRCVHPSVRQAYDTGRPGFRRSWT